MPTATPEGDTVPKDKKKDGKAKKDKKKGNGVLLAKAPKRAAKSLKQLSQNPMVADVVAAALIGMAAALKDSDKARKMANDASAELGAMSKKGAKQSGAMWDLALEIGQRTLQTLAESSSKARRSR